MSNRSVVQNLLDSGVQSIAVVFKHAAIFPNHEQAVGMLAKELGFRQVSLSSEVMQMVKMVPRGFTATADAYLTPHIMRCASRRSEWLYQQHCLINADS